MKLFLAALLVVFMSVGVLHANVEGNAAQNAPAQPAVQVEDEATPDAASETPAQAEPKKPPTVDEAIAKLSGELSQNPEIIEEIKRDAAKRSAKPTVAESQQPADRLQAPNITYNRTQRFNRPMDRIIEFRNAQNVATNEVQFNNLPEPIRSELQSMLGACAQDTSDVTFYSYVSDLQRTRGLSPNYFIDFSKLKSKKFDACAAAAPCDAEGCLFISFNTIGYGHWKKDVTLRVKEWAMRQVDDQTASPVPQVKKPAIVSYFDFSTPCKDGSEAECRINRIWLAGGLSDYTPPQ